MSTQKFKKGDMVYVNTSPKVKMYLNTAKSNEPIRIAYLKTGLVRASSDYMTKLFELSKD